MKLYSRRTIIKYSIITAVITILVAGNVFNYYQMNKKTAPKEQKKIEYQDKNFELETNSKAVEIESEESGYTLDEAQNIAVYEKCNEAVVNITTQVMGYNWFYEPVITSSGSGSGSIIDKRGYVVTNVHVIENASIINISLADGSSYEGKIVGQDKESDIAVLKFEPRKDKDLCTINFGDSDLLKVGQKVIAIGNPFALERTLTTGIVSGLGRPVQESENVIIRNMIQTDAAINPGNSGGPLLNTKGEMIGINTMIMSSSGSSSGIGFAVPVKTAKRVVNDLLLYGKVNRGVMKLSLIQNTQNIANYTGSKISSGMIINRIESGSNAEKAGLKAGTKAVQYGSRFNPKTVYLGGDIITEIDGIKITKLADYYSVLEDKVPGNTVQVKIYRNGEFKIFKITLED
ncbi:MAG: trypsin-like peptidase domain-containing protein [Treponema sp.]|nr:trypsin-like peptidase domain-containing protein [Treponema sp.]